MKISSLFGIFALAITSENTVEAQVPDAYQTEKGD